MASTTTITSTIYFFCLFLSLPNPITASSKVSAVFAFGDSTIDSGNNNHFTNILFRSDHLPYGRDLPSHIPTGRFSNGKLSTDFLVHTLGLKDLLPAYLDPKLTDPDLLSGVSFGSAGAGLDNLTLSLTRVMGLPRQFELFEEALQRITKQAGEEKTRNIIKNALFVISIGTNDMLYNAYLLPARIIQYADVSSYQDFLIQNLESFIERVYGAGGRRFVVTGLPPIGCLPMQVAINNIILSQRGCNVQRNTDSEAYNTKLKSHIHSLEAALNGAKLAYFDIYTPIMDMILNPSKYGIGQTLKGCCGTGELEMGPMCNENAPTCPDPSKYVFWDAVHPTQAVYSVVADYGRQTVLSYLTS